MPAEAIRKPWGTTRQLYCGGDLQIDLIEVVAGGFCSIHCHHHKANLFWVFEGALRVFVGFDPESRRWRRIESVRGPLGTLLVDAGVIHQFEADRPTRALEVYLAPGETVDLEDILRFTTQGGVRP